MVVNNPYESPSPHANVVPSPWIGIVLRVLAVVLWLIDLLAIAMVWSILTMPENVERRASNPSLFYGLAIIGLAMPLLGIAFLGTALWRRSVRFLLAGLLSFLPLGALAIYRAVS